MEAQDLRVPLECQVIWGKREAKENMGTWARQA